MTASFYARIFAVTVVATVGVLLAKILAPFTGAIVWAAFLAFILNPINATLRRWLRGRAAVSAAVLTILTPLAVLLPIVVISTNFIAQSSQLLQRLKGHAQTWTLLGFEDLEQLPYVGQTVLWLQGHVPVTAEQFRSWVTSGLQELLQKAAGMGGAVFLGAISNLVGFFLMLFLLFFFLRDGERMLSRAQRLIPLNTMNKDKLFRDLGNVMRAVVYGITLTAMMQGLMVGVGFAITGLASPVVFGVLATLLAMLPVGGAALVWIPGVIVLCSSGSWGYGMFLLVWGLILSLGDNVVKPLLISGRASMSTLTVFLGVLGGIVAFGPIGIVAGPVVLSLAITLMQFADELRASSARNI